MKAHTSKFFRGWRLPLGPVVWGISGIAIVAVLVAVALNTRAQDVRERGISISPLTFEFRADPGQTVSDTIRVFNAGVEPIFASIQIEDTTPTGERGQAVIGEAGSTTYSIASWTSVEQDVIEIQPGEQRAISFTLVIPENAEPGGHYGAITVENVPQGGLAGSGVSFAQKVAALMLVSVAGDVNEEVLVKDFFIATEETPIRYDWIPTDWILNPSEVTFVTRFENTGSVHEKPAGFVTVTNALGNELAKLPLEQRNVLPGQTRIVETTWQPDGLTLGKIRGQVDAVYGSRNETLFAAAEFWVVPIATLGPWVVGGLVGLILIVLLRKRLALAFRVILRGDAGGGAPKSPARPGKKEKKEKKKRDDDATPPAAPRAPTPPPSEGGRPVVT